MNKINVISPAKINLDLIIKSKRADNYHEISSLIQPIDLNDIISITFTNSSNLIEIDFPNNNVPLEENLITKAAESFYQLFGINHSIKISVRKRIPIGSGMGGGSSNAAATLLGLSKIFNIDSFDKLLEIGDSLGADVPFFLYCRTARVSGKGEEISIVETPPKLRYLLIFPGFSSETKELYDLWDSKESFDSNDIDRNKTKKIIFKKEELYLRNDFIPLLLEKNSEYARIFTTLDNLGFENYSISGSGSTIFSVLNNEADTKEAESYIQSSMDVRAITVESVEGWRFSYD
tara:strand:- start:81 stop:953 length:873 start_codon:yes stop_codon:yes gene_type:complete